MVDDADWLEEGCWDLDVLRRECASAYDAAIVGGIAAMRAGEGFIPDDGKLVVLDLTVCEQVFLRRAVLTMWDGPARMTDAVACVVGYPNAAEFYADHERLVAAAVSNAPLAYAEWKSLLTAAELALSSLSLGGAWDWWAVTGIDDCAAILVLRTIQARLVGVAA